jgi:hypothetical protein
LSSVYELKKNVLLSKKVDSQQQQDPKKLHLQPPSQPVNTKKTEIKFESNAPVGFFLGTNEYFDLYYIYTDTR